MTCRVPRLFSLIALAFLAVAVSPAQAAIYYDHDEINRTLSSSYPRYASDFDISDQLNRNVEHVVAGAVAFVFLDLDFREERVEIQLGDEVIDGGRLSTGFSLFGGLLSCDALVDLNEDGIISYEVRWIQGSDAFKLVSGTLVACTAANAPETPPTNRVPDGGTTVAMLGAAMLVLGGAHRKLKSSIRA